MPSQASAATVPVWPTSSLVTVAAVQIPNRESDRRCRRWPASGCRGTPRHRPWPVVRKRHVLSAAREVEHVDHDVVAGRGEPRAIRRKGQRANSLAARIDVALQLATGRHVPNANLSVAAGHRHPLAVRRKGDRPQIDHGQSSSCVFCPVDVLMICSLLLKPTTASCWPFG